MPRIVIILLLSHTISFSLYNCPTGKLRWKISQGLYKVPFKVDQTSGFLYFGSVTLGEGILVMLLEWRWASVSSSVK